MRLIRTAHSSATVDVCRARSWVRGAKAGEAGWILEADFPTLEDALTALDAEDFQDVKAATETLASTIFLFEVREV